MSTVNRSLFFQIWQHTSIMCISVCITTEGWMSTAFKSWFITVFDSQRGNIATVCFQKHAIVCNFFWLFEKEGGGIWAKVLHWFFFPETEWIIFNRYTLSIFWPTITILAMTRVCVCPDALENHEMLHIPFRSVAWEINEYTKSKYTIERNIKPVYYRLLF